MTRPRCFGARVLVCCVLALATGVPMPARAQSDSISADDQKLSQEAYQLAQAGKTEEALAIFVDLRTRATDKYVPIIDYNIARCYQKLGKSQAALDIYKQLLALEQAPPEILTKARLYRDELEKAQASAVPVKPPPEEPKETPKKEPVEPETPTMVYVGGSVLGAGGLLLLGGLGLDVASASLQDDYQDAADRGDAAEFDRLRDEIDSRQTVVVALYGVGAAAAITGGVLLGLGLAEGSEAASGAEGAGRGALVPWVGEGVGGALWQGTW